MVKSAKKVKKTKKKQTVNGLVRYRNTGTPLKRPETKQIQKRKDDQIEKATFRDAWNKDKEDS